MRHCNACVSTLRHRHGGHSRADPSTYRPEEEVKARLARDPIPAQRQRLLDAGVDEADVSRIEDGVEAAVAAAEKVARDAPDPDPAVATTELWSDGGSQWRS